jgi:hypothetical protein
MNSVQSKLEEWLQNIIATEKPDSQIKVFRFGLSEGYLVYLAGSERYEEADVEWASYPPNFVAREELTISESEAGEWHQMLQQTMEFLKGKLRQNAVQQSFLGVNTPVYTGFVDGDLYRVN